MKQVKIGYFAIYREITGCRQQQLQTAAESPEDLFTELMTIYPGLQRYRQAMVAVNEEMADWGTALADGDEVLFFPPIAGG